MTPLPRPARRTRRTARALPAVVGALVLGLAASSAPGVAAPASDPEADGRAGRGPVWTGTWAAAVTEAGEEGPSATGFTDTTLRQTAHVSLGGSRLRLRLSNAYGDAPLEVGAVTVARRRGPAGTPRIDGSTLRRVTFDGARSTRIPAGAELLSDPVALPVPENSDVVVSIHLPGPTGPATWHAAGYATSYAAEGDAVRAAGAAYDELDTSRYFLSGIDVAHPARRAPRGSVVFFGDSITDGVVSTVDANRRYPDLVGDRLLRREPTRRCGVLNVGISGNRLLSDAGAAGDSALARFDRDVLSRPGARSVVLLLGINDIGVSLGEVATRRLIGVHRQFIRRARDAGLRVVGATLTPYRGAGYYSAAGERDRVPLNRWIRTSGAYDDVVDLDRALRDPDAPKRMLPRFDVGDHLHPNDRGFARMARTLDLRDVC